MKGYLLPWEREPSGTQYHRMLHNDRPLRYLIQRSDSNKKWRLHYEIDKYIYDTPEAAMAVMDAWLKSEGWVLLNEETVLLI
jgi:hypothetical protein